PLLAPPDGYRWGLLWSSEDRAYGGSGTTVCEARDGWRAMGESAVVLRPVAPAIGRWRAGPVRRISGLTAPRSPFDRGSRDARRSADQGVGAGGTPRDRRVARARMARDQRPWRLRIRHHLRRRHAPLPRRPRRGPTRPARPRHDGQPPSRIHSPPRLPNAPVRRRGKSQRATSNSWRRTFGRIPPRNRTPRLALRSGRVRSRKADLLRVSPQHGLRAVPAAEGAG